MNYKKLDKLFELTSGLIELMQSYCENEKCLSLIAIKPRLKYLGIILSRIYCTIFTDTQRKN